MFENNTLNSRSAETGMNGSFGVFQVIPNPRLYVILVIVLKSADILMEDIALELDIEYTPDRTRNVVSIASMQLSR